MFEQLDIPMARKVLEFAEIKHADFIHNQGIFLGVQNKAAVDQWRWEELTGYQTDCGTVGCLAGIACTLAGVKTEPWASADGVTTRTPVNGEGWEDAGARVMGLTSSQASDLFWNMDNETALDCLRTYIQTAEREQAELQQGETK